MDEQGFSPDRGPVTIDHHIHYVAASGKCRPAVVIDAGDGETIAFLLAFTTPDEGHTVWHSNCQHDEEMKMPGTWHFAEYGDDGDGETITTTATLGGDLLEPFLLRAQKAQ